MPAQLMLQGQITVPTGGWSAVVTNSSPPPDTVTATVAAGNYYLSDTGGLLAAFDTALTSASGHTWTVQLGSDAGLLTGQVVITASATVAITWSQTAFRNALGFNGNLSGAASYTSPNHAKYLFRPNCGRSNNMAPDGDDGASEQDFTLALAPSGTTKAYSFTERFVDNLEFPLLTGGRTWINLTNLAGGLTNESLQQFWRDVISIGAPFRYHMDALDPGEWVVWRAEGGAEFKPKPVVPGWTGPNSLWTWSSIVRKAI